MRADQLRRLADLSEKLAEDVLTEADPDNWPGAGIPFEAWDKQVRGDRYWMKKNAAASLMLLGKVVQLQADQHEPPPPGEDEGDDTDTAIQAAEKAAADLLDKTLRAIGKKQFDDHVHKKH